MSNHLLGQTSPYLLEHAENPVDWYPWGEEAFQRAKDEDKPVFLSIGYMSCHWCHVMARESFEDAEIGALLNESFISVKVDREERSDIDSVYMAFCRALSPSAGWPMTLFLTPEGKPFFAGTYFPKEGRDRQPGLRQLLELVRDKWATAREELIRSAGDIVSALARQPETEPREPEDSLLQGALWLYLRDYDQGFGGFGRAPKFPMAHSLLFLLQQGEKRGDERLTEMAETTLLRMAEGGIFDQIGGGFSRYSTDRAFLVPHFEKMLYDNALLILAYARAYRLSGDGRFLDTALRTADYLLRELRGPEGGFFSAQDADSEGEEGKYYLFTPEELRELLGEERGAAFCRSFDITPEGNFEGKSIPNRLRSHVSPGEYEDDFSLLRQYRKRRTSLRCDDKVLTAWNGLAVWALCELYRTCREEKYLASAAAAYGFVKNNLRDGDALFSAFRLGMGSGRAVLTDWAALLWAALALHGATGSEEYLADACRLEEQIETRFSAPEGGGYYLTDRGGEALVLELRESEDGAMPSGNSLYAWALTRLSALLPSEEREQRLRKLLGWLCAEAKLAPTGHAVALLAVSDHLEPPPTVTVVLPAEAQGAEPGFLIPPEVPYRAMAPSGEKPLMEGKTTFYVCRGGTCFPPSNNLEL